MALLKQRRAPATLRPWVSRVLLLLLLLSSALLLALPCAGAATLRRTRSGGSAVRPGVGRIAAGGGAASRRIAGLQLMESDRRSGPAPEVGESSSSGAAVPPPTLHWRPMRYGAGALVFLLLPVVFATLSWLVYKLGEMGRRRRHAGGAQWLRSFRGRAWRSVALVLIGLSPLVLGMLLVGEQLRSLMLAMLTMHWGCMLLLPTCYLAAKAVSGEEEEGGSAAPRTETGGGADAVADGDCDDAWAWYGRFLEHQRKDHLGRQLLWGALFGFLGLVVPLAALLLARCDTWDWALCVRSWAQPMREYGMRHYSALFLAWVGLYFAFVNPIFEEIFWRVFLHRELGLTAFPPPGGAEQERRGGQERPEKKGSMMEKTPLTSETGRWVVSGLYASYHPWPVGVFLAHHRFRWVLIVLGFISLAVLGRVFVYLRENPRFGLMTAILAHVGVDLAVIIGSALFVFNIQLDWRV